MNPLETILREIILEDGPISLDRYMALALAHPVHGYYRTRDPLGREGDFVTAPEISQMFGELIGLWAVEVWRMIGAPRPVRLVELGPGRGTLMADALRAARRAPDFLAAVEVDLVEISAPLRERQRAALEKCGAAVHWRNAIDEIPPGPAIFIANEFFDALPVRHYERRDDGWRERRIGLGEDGRLRFGLGEVEPGVEARGEEGEILEVGVAAHQAMTRIGVRIATQGGALLAVDYGYEQPARGETLQAVKGHRFVDPLEAPGEADLTAHVDFTALARAAKGAGAEAHGPVAQGEFLRRLGVVERAAALAAANEARRASVEAALARLAGEGEGGEPRARMSRLFKAIAVTRRAAPPPPGFGTPQHEA